MKFDRNSLLFYAVTDRRYRPDLSIKDQVLKAIEGGVTFVQLREKELSFDTHLSSAKELKALCKSRGVPFVVNDNVEVAKACNADGVHIGQNDMELKNARRILGTDKIIGVSVQTVSQAIAAEKGGADYLGVGAIFPTGSKDDAVLVSIEMLKKIVKSVSIPVVAIGGICDKNITALSKTGIAGICVISALFHTSDIKKSAKALRAQIERGDF